MGQCDRVAVIFDPQSVLSHRIKMRPSRNEDDVGTAFSEPRPEVAAYST
jgi:hypothetical protein